MKKVYISSTYKDLKEYREAAARALRKIRYDVVRMEEYAARDERTRAACEGDVGECDIYVGIFAWRYGHVPDDDNATGLSITELEYRAAAEKPRLIFLLADEAAWPSTDRDAETGDGDRGQRIRELRKELAGFCAGYFSSPAELATEVMAAVVLTDSKKSVQRFEVMQTIKDSVELGPSYLPNIQAKVLEAARAELVEIRLGPTPWWTTRLHLVSALACDFTAIGQFVFVDEDGTYLTMASPIEVRRALTRRIPQLEQSYLAARPEQVAAAISAEDEIEFVIGNYQQEVFLAFGDVPEEKAKQDVSPLMLTRDLGIQPSAETMESGGPRGAPLPWEIVRRQLPYVALLNEGRLSSVVDRSQMADQVASEVLAPEPR